MKSILIVLLTVVSTSMVQAKSLKSNSLKANSANSMDEINPFAENIEATLQEMDADYEAQTGKSATDFGLSIPQNFSTGSCSQLTCEVYAQIVKSEQKLYLYVNGVLQARWDVSTGDENHETPLLNQHPDGRIYDAYTSKKFPGGDYNGLGKMPYAVFIKGGFAVHGTGKPNWPKLGKKASHGCVRVHPDNALYFNRLVRQAGVDNTWISIQN